MNHYFKWRLGVALLVAVIVALILASIFHSQFVLYELTLIGIDITLSKRITMTVSDLAGLAPGYGAIILLGYFIGFSVIGLVRRYIHWSPEYAFTLGGGLTIAAIHWLMYPIFFITLIAGARTPLGFAFQCLAGLVGGFVFARVIGWARKAPANQDS